MPHDESRPDAVADESEPFLRTRLIDALGGHHRIVIVRAPRGFGKTKLLRRWATAASTTTRIAWWENKKGSAASTFWRWLESALREGLPADQAQDEETAYASVVAQLARASGNRAIILDDFEMVTNPQTLQRLVELLDVNQNLRLIVAVRSRHPLESRLPRVHESLVLSGDDLALEPTHDSRESSQTAGLVREAPLAVRVLREALADQDWTLIADVFEQSWLALVRADEDLVITTLRQMPERFARDHPRTHAVRHIIREALVGPEVLPSPVARTFLTALALMGDIDVVDALEIAIVELLALRRSGRFGDAVRMARAAHELARVIGPAIPEPLIPLIPMARLQLALAFELAGESDDATEQLMLALAAAESMSPVSRRELNLITGMLAVSAASEGNVRDAGFWGERELHVEGTVSRMWLVPHIPSAHRIARAITAVDRLDRAAADDALAAVRLTEARDEHWALTAVVQARYDLVWSDHRGALRNLQSARLRHREWHNAESAAEPILVAAEVDLFLAAGQGNRASRALMTTRSRHPAIELARARLSFLAGNLEDALATSRDLLRVDGATDRVRLDTLLLRASALGRVGRTEAALSFWDEACRMAQRMGDPLLPFAMTDSDQLLRAAASIPQLARIAKICSDRGVGTILPDRISVVTLTSREYAVLEKLARNMSVASIAREHYVSEATVKTQLRGLYAKLDAHSRAEAVTAARAVGLI